VVTNTLNWFTNIVSPVRKDFPLFSQEVGEGGVKLPVQHEFLPHFSTAVDLVCEPFGRTCREGSCPGHAKHGLDTALLLRVMDRRGNAGYHRMRWLGESPRQCIQSTVLNGEVC